MDNLKKIWQTKEFKDAKKNFEMGDKCCKCGSKDKLTPHHLLSFSYLKKLFLREVGISELCKLKGVTFSQSSITNAGGIQTSNGYIKAMELRDFIGQHPEYKQIAEELAKKEYFSFNNVETICGKCHWASHNHMELCHMCKKKYHHRNKDCCMDCKEEFDKGYKEFSDHMDNIEKEMGI